MSKNWNELAERMAELKDLSSVIGLLSWDQETVMPAKAGNSRAEQTATLQAILHERLSSPRLDELLESLAGDASLNAAQKASVRNLTFERNRATKLPVGLVRELAETQSRSVEAWRAARAAKKFSDFAPFVERLLKIRQQQADLWGHSGERYDALLQGYEPGMSTARLEPLFANLRQKLVPLVKAIAHAEKRPDAGFVKKSKWSVDKQWKFSMQLLEAIGFDLEAGRQDKSAHPFSSGANVWDVRLTNRFDEADPFSSVFSALHEGGHGLYEQGFDPALHRTYATGAPSMGLHESQSRLWENLVGRSLPFWRAYAPKLREHFGRELEGVSAEQLHGAVNLVQPSLIRVEADEVTYNLHILLRFELELALIRGDLKPKDLPGAWNERMKSYLGIVPPDDGVGVLQDIHWSWGEFGYFPTYTLGNLYSVCWMEAAEKALPKLWTEVERGNLIPLRDWLRDNVHKNGYIEHAEPLVQRVTGAQLSEEPFLRYLWKKFGPIYGVHAA
ncbi:MAG: carboxypeptidase M32 [Deltaproteobacteria bacterium]|nr:carboxypeptidase M32 [Deltaproteobacteria bacterium]